MIDLNKYLQDSGINTQSSSLIKKHLLSKNAERYAQAGLPISPITPEQAKLDTDKFVQDYASSIGQQYFPSDPQADELAAERAKMEEEAQQWGQEGLKKMGDYADKLEDEERKKKKYPINEFVYGAALVAGLLPNQKQDKNDRYIQMGYNPYSEGTGSKALYRKGGQVPMYHEGAHMEDEIQENQDVPAGYHYMPDGSLMSDSEMVYDATEEYDEEGKPYYASGGSLSAAKAREILHDGTVHGRPITDRQRRYFGFIAGGGQPSAEEGMYLYEGGGGLDRSEDYGSKKKPYPSVDSGDFAGGGRSYPIPTRADAVDALRLAGLHGRSDVRAKVFRKYPGLKKAQAGLPVEGEPSLESGMVVDKRTGKGYIVKNGKIQKTINVLTGENVEGEANTVTNLDEDIFKQKATPRGYYKMSGVDERINNPYDWKEYEGNIQRMQAIPAHGMEAPQARNLAIHQTYDPKNRNKLYGTDKPYASFGCVNCKKPDIQYVNKMFPQGDTMRVMDSRNAADRAYLEQYISAAESELPWPKRKGGKQQFTPFKEGGKVYKGDSIVDYLKSEGAASSYGARKELFSKHFGEGYKGTAKQNIALLNFLREGQGEVDAQPTAKPTMRRAITQKEITPPPQAPSAPTATPIQSVAHSWIKPKGAPQPQPNALTPYNAPLSQQSQAKVPLHPTYPHPFNYTPPRKPEKNERLESGVVIDKRKGKGYVIKNGKIDKTIDVITGSNVEGNVNTVQSLESGTFEQRTTPVGNYLMGGVGNVSPEVAAEYGQYAQEIQPISAYGMPAPESGTNLGIHKTYDAKNREKLYGTDQPYASFGCINCKKPDIEYINQQFSKGDTLRVIDSKRASDRKYLENYTKPKAQQVETEQTPWPMRKGRYQDGGKIKKKSNLFETDQAAYADSIMNANQALNFVKRYQYPDAFPNRPNPDLSESTHLMASSDAKVYPQLVQLPDGTLVGMDDLNDFQARNYAENTGEIIDFQGNEERANWFAKGGYKKAQQKKPKGTTKIGFMDVPTYAPGGPLDTEGDPTKPWEQQRPVAESVRLPKTFRQQKMLEQSIQPEINAAKAIVDENVARRKERNAATVAERMRRIKQSNEAKSVAGQLEAMAIEDKMRFFPEDAESWVDEYINPLPYIGAMADRLGKSMRSGDPVEYAKAISEPLIMGAIGGLLGPKGGVRKGILQNIPGYGAKKEAEIVKSNKWLRDWYSHPKTQERYKNFIKEEGIPGDDIFGEEARQKLKDLTIWDEDIVQGIKKGYDDPSSLGRFSYADNSAWVDLFNPHFFGKRKTVENTGIHEGIHALTLGNFGFKQGATDFFTNAFKTSSKKYDKYLTKATEIHARLGELRNTFGLTPDSHVSMKDLNNIIDKGLKGKTTVDPRFFKLIKDKKQLQWLFNNAPAALPAVGLGAAAASQVGSGGEEGYRAGGEIPIYPEGGFLGRDVTGATSDLINQQESYIKSPLYRRRLKQSGVANADQVVKDRLKNLGRVRIETGDSAQAAYYAGDPFIQLSPKSSEDTAIHEISHITNQPLMNAPAVNLASGKSMSAAETWKFINKAKNIKPELKKQMWDIYASDVSQFGQYTDPSTRIQGYDPHDISVPEMKSDLDAVRHILFKNKITPTYGADLTPEMLKKARQNKTISEAPHFKRFSEKFSDEDIISLNNEIAMQQAQKPTMMAKSGKKLKKKY